jgi:hypothetical protein
MVYTFLEVAPNYIGFFIAIYTLNVTFYSSFLENLEKVSQQRAGYHLVESNVDDIPQLTEEENMILNGEFSEKEVFESILQMETNKAPGPDAFPTEFYRKFWDIIKVDILTMFATFHRGELPLFHLNFGTIILLPKKEDAIQIQQYVQFVY